MWGRLIVTKRLGERGLLLKLRRRAEAIHNRPPRVLDEEQAEFTRLVLPSSTFTESLQRDMGPQARIAASSGIKIADLVTIKRPHTNYH